MSGTVKGLTVELGGETKGLEAALKDVGKAANDINKELGLVEKGLKFDPGNSTLLAQKQELLTQKIAETRKGLDALRQAEERVEAMYKSGEIDAGQYRQFRRELATTESKLNTFEKQVKDVDGTQKKAKTSTKELDGHFSNLGSTAGGLATKIAAAGAAYAGFSALKGMATAVLDNADNLQKLSDKTGLSAERLQELGFIGDDLGVDLETVAGAQAKLTKSMNAGRDGTGAQADAFAKLGISVTDSNGNLRDAKTVMMEAFGALNGVGNETERDALAMAIFGKSAQDLNPLIGAGTDKLAELAKQARDSGSVMSNEAVAGLDEFGDSMDHLKSAVLARFGEAFANILPYILRLVAVLKPVAEKIFGLFKNVFSALKTGDFGEAFALIGDAVGDAIPKIASFLARLGREFFEWIGPLVPPMLVKLGELLSQLGNWIIHTALPMVVAKLVELEKAFAAWIGPALPGILLELGKILLALGRWIITEALPAIIVNFGKLALGLVEALGTALGPLGLALAQPFVDAWNAVSGFFSDTFGPGIADFFGGIPAAILGALGDLGNLLLDAGKAVLNGLWTGIKWVWDTLIFPFYVGIPLAVLGAVGDLASTLLDAGKSLLTGLWNGLKWVWEHSVAPWLRLEQKILDAVGNLAQTLLSKGKDLLGGLWDGMKWVWDNSISGWLKIGEKIRSAVGNLGSVLYGAGKAVLDGLYDGMKWVWDHTVAPFLNQTKRLIPDWKGPIEDDRRLLIPAGEAIMGGLIRGMEGQLARLRQTATDVSAIIAGAMPERAHYSVTTRVLPAMAGGAQAAAAFGPGVVIQNLTVVAPDPRTFMRELEREVAMVSRARGGR